MAAQRKQLPRSGPASWSMLQHALAKQEPRQLAPSRQKPRSHAKRLWLPNRCSCDGSGCGSAS
eukprot:11297734-Karenia_brevis.AAC.1